MSCEEFYCPVRVVIHKKDRIDYIINGLCEYYNITFNELRGRACKGSKERKRIAVKLLRDVADCQFKEICVALKLPSRVAVCQLYYDIRDDLAEDTYGNKELKSIYDKILKYLRL